MQLLTKLSKSIIFSLLLCSQLNSFVDFRLMQKDENMILLIGDAEIGKLNHMNEMHVKWFQEILQKFCFQTPTCVIYELSEKTAELIQQDNLPIDLIINTPKTYFHLAKMAPHFLESTKIKFLPFDFQKKENEIIEDFFSTLGCLFTNTLNLNAWKKFKRELSSALQKTDISLTTSAFLESLTLNSETLEQWRDAFQPDSAEYNLSNELLLKYKSGVSTIKEHLKMKPDIDIRANIASLCNKCKTTNTLEAKFLELMQLFCLETDFILLDLGFLKQILKSFQDGYHKTIVVTRWSHTKNIFSMLEKIGYKTISEFSIMNYEGFEKNSTIKSKDIMDLPTNLSPALCMFFDKSMSHEQILEIIKKHESANRFCNNCNAPETELLTLSSCARCKKVFYCNRECQKKDWPTHKQMCIAVT